MFHKNKKLLLLLTLLAFISFAVATGFEGEKAAHEKLKIMTYNIGNGWGRQKPGIQELVNAVQEQLPDILLLQEVNFHKAGELAKRLNYISIVTPNDAGKRGDVAILSHYPLRLIEAIELPDTKKGANAICAETEIMGQQLIICSVHLDHIPLEHDRSGMLGTSNAMLAGLFLRETFCDTLRGRQAEKLVKYVSEKGFENVVIGGDFNAMFLFRAIRIMRENFKDSAWPSPAFFFSTHKAPGFLMPIKIDYIFVSENLDCFGTRILKHSPGDHYPVITNLIFQHCK